MKNQVDRSYWPNATIPVFAVPEIREVMDCNEYCSRK